MKMTRSDWPLWAQAKHAVRYPHLWTTDELRLLVAAVKESE